MSVISLPAGFCPNSFTMRQQTTQRVFASPFGGSEQVIDMLNDRWLISLSLPARKFADAARVEAFINGMRGMTNTVLLYHWVRKQPRGTLRGTPQTAFALAGDPYFVLGGGTGDSLLAGDMVGLDGLLYQVSTDSFRGGDGQIVVQLVNRLRRTLPPATPVVWDRPTAPFRLSSTSAVSYTPGYATETSLDFIEAVG